MRLLEKKSFSYGSSLWASLAKPSGAVGKGQGAEVALNAPRPAKCGVPAR